MSANKITIDTNILVYAFDKKERQRHQLALKVLEKACNTHCILLLQSLSELFYTLTRKKIVSIKEAEEIIHDLTTLFPVATANQNSLHRAITLTSHHKISFWDAMICAAARDTGASILLSEDFQHEQLIGNIRVVNPFLPNNYWSVHF